MAKSEVHWETIHGNRGEVTERLPVPGGWIYRTQLIPYSEDLPATVALVFVPDPNFKPS